MDVGHKILIVVMLLCNCYYVQAQVNPNSIEVVKDETEHRYLQFSQNLSLKNKILGISPDKSLVAISQITGEINSAVDDNIYIYNHHGKLVNQFPTVAWKSSKIAIANDGRIAIFGPHPLSRLYGKESYLTFYYTDGSIIRKLEDVFGEKTVGIFSNDGETFAFVGSTATNVLGYHDLVLITFDRNFTELGRHYFNDWPETIGTVDRTVIKFPSLLENIQFIDEYTIRVDYHAKENGNSIHGNYIFNRNAELIEKK